MVHDLGWSSKKLVITLIALTWDGGACRIPQRVLCGGRSLRGWPLPCHGVQKKSVPDDLLVPVGARLLLMGGLVLLDFNREWWWRASRGCGFVMGSRV